MGNTSQRMTAMGVTVLATTICSISLTNAQMREIPKDGLDDITPDVLRYEPENEFRRQNGLGMTSPAKPGTPPGSTDPRNLAGVWMSGPVYLINKDGSYTNAESAPGRASPATPASAPAVAPAATATTTRGSAPRMSCVPSGPFTMSMPSRIIQTGDTIHILSTTSWAISRRIEMNGTHPAKLTPTYAGHSIGHWEGDWLVIETVGLKGRGGFGTFNSGANLTYSPSTKVTERIRKTDSHMLLENFVTIEDPSLKEPIVRRVTAYYRPDLDATEAPCEEYSDPFEGTYVTTPFEGNAEGPKGVGTDEDVARLKARAAQQQ